MWFTASHSRLSGILTYIMKKNRDKRTLKPLIVSVLIFINTSVAYSQELQDNAEKIGTQEATPQVEKSLNDKLDELSDVLKEQNAELRALKKRKSKKNSDPKLEDEIVRVSHQLETLSKSFEQLAIGNINLDTISTQAPNLTWQEELTLAIKPLLENLRGLTEGPRKRDNLRQLMSHQKSIVEKSEKALVSIEGLLSGDASKNQQLQLKITQSKWQRIKEDAEREEKLALYQLQSLTGSQNNWFINLKESAIDFVQERGLTIALAILVSIIIWLVLASLSRLLDKTGKSMSRYSSRTTYRVIAYAQRLLTMILIVVGVLTVFFIRGDILLLVISLTLLFAAALGLKSLVPQFLAESRLLLNIGAVREREQIMIDGVPWKVSSINMFSKFSNPEIQGTLRLPLSDLKGLKSRPVNDEKWFPSSIGDWVLDSANTLYEVIRQTPVIVELQSAQGTNKLVPTSTYFSAEFVNLTKSKRIRITSLFGVGYELQSIALDEVPRVFQAAVTEHLKNASLGTEQIDVRVELSKAGASSLDYIVIAQLGSSASKYFYRIERTIQQACVDACNQQGWGIPFPQLTVHHQPIQAD